MRVPRRLWLLLGCATLVAAVLLIVAKVWVVPALIVGQIRAQYGGRVTIGDWWIDGSTSGVTSLTLHEGPDHGSPAWLSAGRVTTDLSLGSLLRGRLGPGRITIQDPRVTVRIDRDGEALTRIPLGNGDGATSAPPDLPEVSVRGGRLTFRQEGRGEMVVHGLGARLTPNPDGARLTAEADDPTWGRLRAEGQLGPGRDATRLRLWSESLVADPDKAARIPFVPEEAWDHVLPDGPLGVVLTIVKPDNPAQPPSIRTVIDYQQSTLDLPTLGIKASGTTGTMVVEEGVVRLEGMRGQAIGGRIAAGGSLDFAREPAAMDLTLKLDGVDVAETPRSWQLDEAGLTGRLSGAARLLVRLTEQGADLTGSSGEATLSGGTIGDIPVKSLKLTMQAEGSDLRYETASPGSSWLGRVLATPLVALQAPSGSTLRADPMPQESQPPGPKRGGGLILPKTISTEVEFEDVDLTQVLSKADALGLHLPFVAAGRLSLKAEATIPLGSLRDLRAYVFHGEAKLEGAHIAGVDLGLLTARLDLADGILDLRELKGQFVDMPRGGLTNRPAPTSPVPDEGPLPPGGFRGRLRAQLDPPGRLEAHFEGNRLPLGEIAAPALPRPTPLSGEVDVEATLGADLAHASNPGAWSLDAHLTSRRIAYHGATFDAVSAAIAIRDGRLTFSDLVATLEGQPLRGNAGVGLAAPYPFELALNVEAWDLAKLLAFVPNVPRPSPVQGRLSAKAEANGMLSPRRITGRGEGHVGGFRTGVVDWGDVPLRWSTGEDAIEIVVSEARPFGGALSASARIPIQGGPITGSATLKGIDMTRVAEALPADSLQLAGHADGRVTFVIQPRPPEGSVPVAANIHLEADDLVVQGVPARAVQARVTLDRGEVDYELEAESLGGKVRLRGKVPLGAGPGSEEADVEGRLQVINVVLRKELWNALGESGALAYLEGRGALDANVLVNPSNGRLRARGIAEVRDLRWGPKYPLGRLRGTFAYSPGAWEVRPLTGELFGGTVVGDFAGLAPDGEAGERWEYHLQVDRASLARLVAVEPGLERLVEGEASLRLSGRLAEALRADGELLLPRGRVAGIPVSDLRAPLDVSFIPASNVGDFQSRRWSARLAGGRVLGDLSFRFGTTRAFRAEARLTDLDLESLSRSFTGADRPMSGKLSGQIDLGGLDALRSETYQGRADLELTDAQILDTPVFRALDRFLGGPAGGGVFEKGYVRAAIRNREADVEELALYGRVVQLHASGTIGFDTRLQMVVLINTNQIIPQTGQALLTLIPGLRDARGPEATLRVANFLSNRLIKLRVGGTIRNPSVTIDPTVTVGNASVSFFAGAFKLPLGLLK